MQVQKFYNAADEIKAKIQINKYGIQFLSNDTHYALFIEASEKLGKKLMNAVGIYSSNFWSYVDNYATTIGKNPGDLHQRGDALASLLNTWNISDAQLLQFKNQILLELDTVSQTIIKNTSGTASQQSVDGLYSTIKKSKKELKTTVDKIKTDIDYIKKNMPVTQWQNPLYL